MNRLYATTRHHQARAPKARTPEGSWKAVVVFAIVTAVSLAGYLAEVSSTSSKGFEIRKLQSDIATLKDESAKSEFRLAEGQSVQSLEQKVQSLGMVPTDHVEYIVPTNPVVARR